MRLPRGQQCEQDALHNDTTAAQMAKEPCISAKDPCISAKEPCIFAKEPCICTHDAHHDDIIFSQNTETPENPHESKRSADGEGGADDDKETAKEPCMSAKEPCMSAKEPVDRPTSEL